MSMSTKTWYALSRRQGRVGRVLMARTTAAINALKADPGDLFAMFVLWRLIIAGKRLERRLARHRMIGMRLMRPLGKLN
jgi:hypothetical protein